MRVILNEKELRKLMNEHDIKNIRQLAEVSGTSEQALYSSMKRQTLSKENYWLLAKYFKCHIEDLQTMIL